MKRLQRSMALAAACVSITVLSMAGASAQQLYNRYVTFGDSLSDPGNLYALTGGAKPPSPYFNGHFSNGITWAEMVAPPTNTFFSPGVTGNVDYAFGGSRTDVLGNLNNLTTVPGSTFGTAYTTVNAPPGIPVQIASYVNRGGSFSGSTMTMIWGGANNFFNLFDTSTAGGNNPANNPTLPGFILPNTASILATATSAASDIGTSVNTVYTVGGRNVLVLNLPNLGLTPNFNGSATTAAAGTGASTAFNSALSQTLAGVKALHPDLNLIQVDINSVLTAAVANPSGFGLSNVTQACINVASCVTGSLATQNSYLFWDSVHPTTTGQQVIAATVNQYLNAPLLAVTYAPLATMSLQERQATANIFLDAIDPVSGRGEGYFLTTNYLNGSARNSAIGGTYNWTGGSGTAGGVVRISDAWTGSFGVSLDDGTLGIGSSGARFITGSLDFAAIYRADAFFDKISAGVASTDFSNMHRATVGPLSNSASVTGFGGSVIDQIGMVYRSAGVTFEPEVKIGIIDTMLGSYTESGIVAPIAFNSRAVTAFVGGGDVRIGYDLGTKAAPITAFATLGYDAYFGVSNGAVAGSLANNTANGFSSSATSLVNPGVVAGLGVSGKINDTSTIDVGYTGTFGPSSTDVHRVHANLTVHF